MKRLLSLVAFFATLQASAQQVNPVPDYVFANRMSAGRNTVTDTAAYFSIGPRYGATRGMMPPMVVDTASFSANKRNGLLIFSVQKNKFLYWDSVGVKWAEMAGTGGTAISSGDTATMLSPYVRHAGYGLTKSGQSFLVDTLNISTRAWRQKGLDSLAALEISGSGTTNYVPKFTAASTIGNSQIFDNGTSVGIGTASPAANIHIHKSQPLQWLETTESNKTILELQSTNNDVRIGSTYNTGGSGYKPILFYTGGQERMRFDENGNLSIGKNSPYAVYTRIHTARSGYNQMVLENTLDNIMGEVAIYNGSDPFSIGTLTNHFMNFKTNGSERMRIFANGRVFIGSSPADAGFQFDVNGTMRTGTFTINTNGNARTISTFRGANSDGDNIWIGGGGANSVGSAGNTSLGSYNVTIGASAGNALTTGFNNVAIGVSSLLSATSGNRNSALGVGTLQSTTDGYDNVAIGVAAMSQSTTAHSSNAVGVAALFTNTTGNNNNAFGRDAGRYTNAETSNQTSTNSLYLGNDTRASASGNTNEIVVGHAGRGNGSNTVTIGNSSITDNYFSGALRTSAPTDGTAAPWRLGSYNASAPTATGYIEVLVNGVKYKLLAATY